MNKILFTIKVCFLFKDYQYRFRYINGLNFILDETHSISIMLNPKTIFVFNEEDETTLFKTYYMDELDYEQYLDEIVIFKELYLVRWI